jgi:hypothetical protein
MTETIICPLWDENDRRFRSRRYHTWDRPCCACGRKVAVNDAVKRKIDADCQILILCEQCVLVQSQELTLGVLAERQEPTLTVAEGRSSDYCAVCEALKKAEEIAAVEKARCDGLPDRKAAERAHKKWAHLSTARSAHRFKANH